MFFANFAVTKLLIWRMGRNNRSPSYEIDGLTTAQLADNLGDIVFLKEPNGGDASGPGFTTGRRVFERDASER
jgi:hypothetical protein